MDGRIIRLEEKITFLENFVAQQNEVIVGQGRQIDKLMKAVKALSEKTESLGDPNAAPANEKPPHW